MGGSGNDYLNGGADNDHLNGESGSDYLNGESGNDHIHGGVDADVDRLFGGGDGDHFYRHWTVIAGNVHGTIDILEDFSEWEDEDVRP